MCDGAVEVGEVCRSHDRDPEALLASRPRLRTLTEHGLIRHEGMSLTIPDAARAFVRNVAVLFDAQLGTSAAVHSCAA